MTKKIVALVLSISITIISSACGAPDLGKLDNPKENAKGSRLGSTIGWIDSDIIEAIDENDNIRLEDDYAAAVNKEWKLSMGDTFHQVFQGTADRVLEKKKQAVINSDIEGVEAKVLRDYYNLASDWDYKSKLGIEPLKPYLNDIESIKSYEDLMAFTKDLKRNPLAFGPISVDILSAYHSEKFPDCFITIIGAPELSLSDYGGSSLYDSLGDTAGFAAYEALEGRAIYLLGRAGYTEKDAKKILQNSLSWEKKVARADDTGGISKVDSALTTKKEAMQKAGDFPLEEIIDSWGFSSARAVLIPSGYAKKLSSLWSKRNLEKIKDYLLLRYAFHSAKFLDREAYDKYAELGASRSQKEIDFGKSPQQMEDELIFGLYIGQTAISGAMDYVYLKNYFDDSVTGELVSMTRDVIDAYKVIFSEEEWLSDEGKKACIEKLDAISINVAWPSFEALDYNNMQFTAKENGGNFLDAYFEANRFEIAHKAYISQMQYSADYWEPLGPDNSTTVTNAYYNPNTNGIYILAGICEYPAYSPELTYEEKLGGLFAIVGHEITHGFDENGSLYDKEGMEKSWLPEEDRTAFADRCDKVASYYDTFTPFAGAGLYDGKLVSAEATADMGGIKAMLTLAKQKPDFDYDLFFRSYARNYRVNIPYDVEKYFLSDVHPLGFYRVNIGLQQFDEFIETYGIKEGDGMYLDPENRVSVW